MLIILGYMQIPPPLLTLFMDEIHALAKSVRQRAGNLSYDAAVQEPLTGKIVIAERWEDQVALSTHLDAPDTLAFIARWQPLMEGAVLKYDVLNERALMAV
ncbi:antibiotic biosynthesis monooxygenase [Pantoea sp. Mb-10]|uniref:putative quinol monooxygenase n=1 Tax=unclassified Pantoea TaxID=2630326 RepID=UPI001E2ED929|nr:MULTISPECIES: antibiotic biosynthesis monooxygenase [unclassified Pantoea]MCE0491592.1 antibiotic biosynthesis monooxygenase [Pantoea sp. Mb-10]MCE0502406.1 antibiotic biosynthesis monooxygenase [Pantoea sp. Pb-8]